MITQPQKISTLYTEALIPIYLLEEKLRTNFVVIQKRLDSNQQSINNNDTFCKNQFNLVHQKLKSFKQQLDNMAPHVEKHVQKLLQAKINFSIVTKLNEYKQSGIFSNDSSQKNQKEYAQTIKKQIKQAKSQMKLDLLKQNETILSNQIKQAIKQLKNISTSSPKLIIQKKIIQNPEISPIKIQSFQSEISNLKLKNVRNSQLIQLNEKITYENTNQLNDKLNDIIIEFEKYRNFNEKNIEINRKNIIKLQNKLDNNLLTTSKQNQSTFQNQLQNININMLQMIPRTEFINLYWKKIKKEVEIHDDQIKFLRRQLNRMEQLNIYTNKLNDGIENFQQKFIERFHKLEKLIENGLLQNSNKLNEVIIKFQDKNIIIDNDINILKTLIQTSDHKIIQLDKQILQINTVFTEIKTIKERLVHLEYINNFEAHMDQIHELLDRPYVQNSKMRKKTQKLPQINYQQKIQTMKEQIKGITDGLKTNVQQIKLMQAKKQDIHQIWKALNILQTRIEQNRNEALLKQERKWNCSSCDKNLENNLGKMSISKNLDAMINKKLEPLKFGGFGQKQGSSKNLKIFGSQERQDRIDKIKEKYASQSIKLPDILQDKLQTSRQSNQ